jgi:Holliday junction DNA helicase RuvA
MIAKLSGIVDSLGGDWAVIDVSGVGYLVFCSGRCLNRLVVGETVSLLIDTHVREDHIHLYGFIDAAERDWYRLLTTVQGVGAKVGLAILGVLGTGELSQAMMAEDRDTLCRAPGVGPKLANRILRELKDKVGEIALGASALAAPAAGGESGAAADAVSALINLGYNPSQALAAVSQAADKLKPEAGAEALIRGGLSELGPREHN